MMVAGKITFVNEPDFAEPTMQEIVDEGGCVWPPPGTDVEGIDRLMREADEEGAISEVPDGRGADQSG